MTEEKNTGAPEELEGAELLISSPEELPDAAARLI